MIGHSLSHYHISAELGRGGMGIVYRATDTKLNRDVALKILPAAALASDDDRARFFREAQSAAQLHHPNIATVFEIDEAVLQDGEGRPVNETDGPRPYIIMELIDGETLQEKIKKAPLSLADAVKVASQVAEALKAAHAKNIVHRDIKSANVMITEDGVAKVLDFGLAKTNQSTMLTRMGSTLGTVSYMSPEQARGQEVDGRTDLYSLGTMMYEMVAGRLPFAGEYEQAVVYSILNEPPEPLTSLRSGVPMDLERLVNKLLAKDADYRYQSAAGLLADLKSIDLGGSGMSRRSMAPLSASSITAAPDLPAAAGTPRWVWPVVAAALLLGLASAWLLKPSPSVMEDTVVRELILDIPEVSRVTSFEVSPDGRALVMSAFDSLNRRGMYRLDLSTRSLEKMPGALQMWSLRFSADESRVTYGENDLIYIMPTSGGVPTPIAQASRRGAEFLNDGSLIFSHKEHGGLWISPESGDAPHELVSIDSTLSDLSGFRRIPDSSFILFHAQVGSRQLREMYLLDVDELSIRPLGPGAFARWLPTDHLIYQAGPMPFLGPLMARPFDVRRGVFTGPEVAVKQQIGVWQYDVDAFGNLYASSVDGGQAVDEQSYLSRYSVEGTIELVGFENPMEDPRVSPDGKQIAVSVDSPDGDDWIEVMDFTTGVARRLTFDGDADFVAWSRQNPDQIMIERSGQLSIFSASGDGILQDLPITDSRDFDWSPDGRWVVHAKTGNPFSLWLFDMETEADTLLDEIGWAPRFSPDGQYIAYTKRDGTGGSYSVVRDVFGPGYSRLTLPGEQNRRPIWAPDGQSMMVDVLGNQGHRIPIDISDGFRQLGNSVLEFDSDRNITWDFHPNGDVYVVSEDRDIENSGMSPEGASRRLFVTMNWSDRVAELAPPSQK